MQVVGYLYRNCGVLLVQTRLEPLLLSSGTLHQTKQYSFLFGKMTAQASNAMLPTLPKILRIIANVQMDYAVGLLINYLV